MLGSRAPDSGQSPIRLTMACFFENGGSIILTFSELCARLEGGVLDFWEIMPGFPFTLWEDVMRTLQVFFGVSVVVALLGFNVVCGDVVNKSEQTPITFSLDIGDGSSMPEISFCAAGGAGEDTAQTTCVMTPGGTAVDITWEEPWYPRFTEPLRSIPQILAPLSSLGTPPRYEPRRPPYPPQPHPRPPRPVVPEPTTLVLFGLGIGVATMTRWRWVNG